MSVDLRIAGAEALEKAGDLAASERVRFQSDLVKEARIFGLDMVRRSKKDYLSGPRSLSRLGVRSGRLRASIASDVRTSKNEVEIIEGTNVAYAPAHELGFEGTVQVPAHVRVISKVFGRSVSASAVPVRAHSRNVSLPERPFLAPAREDALPRFEAKILELLGGIQIGGE